MARDEKRMREGMKGCYAVGRAAQEKPWAVRWLLDDRSNPVKGIMETVAPASSGKLRAAAVLR